MIVRLEFRDEALHFDWDPTEYRALGIPVPDPTYGHTWEMVDPAQDPIGPGNYVCCDQDPVWVRWTIAHPNYTNLQLLCAEHAYEIAKNEPSLRGVLCARNPHDEFNSIMWEQDVTAEFPIP